MDDVTEPTLEQFRSGARAMWARGDYRPIGERLRPAALHLVERAGVTAGHHVLDVGVGTGNVSVVAARRGATVVGVDISEHWWDTVHRYAAAEGVEVELHVGDAEELPVPSDAFDVVLSNFAMIFAPRHDRVVRELVRAARPGGTIGFTAWPPGAGLNTLRDAFADRLPPAPSWAQTPLDWGDPDTIRDRFAAHGIAMDVTENELHWTFPSLDDYVRWLVENSGPLQTMLAALEGQGIDEEVQRRLREAVAEGGEETPDGFRSTLVYLVAVGARAEPQR